MKSVAQNYFYKNYSLPEGLPQSQVYVIYQDSRGNLWFGTNSGGICKYDGRSFITYTSYEGLIDNIVYEISEDKEGNLWVGTFEGVSVFDGKNFITLRNLKELYEKPIKAIFKDSKGNLLFGTNTGLYKLAPPVLRNGLVNRLFTHDKFKQTTVNVIFEDSQHHLWIGTDSGIYKLVMPISNFKLENSPTDPVTGDPLPDKPGYEQALQRFTVEDGLAHNSVLSILEDKKGDLWVGTQMGLCLINRKHINSNKIEVNSLYKKSGSTTKFIIIKDLYGKEIKSLLEDKNGNIWIATSGNGLWKYDRWGFTNLTKQHGLNSNRIWSILQDRENNLWLGTDGSGVIKCIRAKFTSITEKDGLTNNVVTSILKDSKGNFWFGTYNGVNKLVPTNKTDKISFKKTAVHPSFPSAQKFYYYNETNGFSNKKIWSIIEDKRGNIWFASYGDGIFKLPPRSNKFINYNENDGLINDNVRAIFEDKAGNIWVGTEKGLSKIMVVNDKTIFKILENIDKDALVHNTILAIIQDSKENIWFATLGRGLCKYDGLTFTNYTQHEGLINNIVLSIAEDDEGNIWAATFGGVSKLIPESGGLQQPKFSNITRKDGLSSNTVYIIRIDNEGNLLIGTNNGLDKLDLNKFNKNGEIDLKHYGFDEGFSGLECNANASFKDKQGNIWFGTINGAIQYRLAYDTLNRAKSVYDIPNLAEPQIHITGLRLFFEDVEWKKMYNANDTNTQHPDPKPRQLAGIEYTGVTKWYHLPVNLVLPYNQNHLTFEFIGISLKVPEKVKYQWMLEGFEDKWSHVTSKYEATYSNLPHGNYVFKVKACNNDGLWNKHPAEFSLVINPPFWNTWWFYTICLVTLIGSIYIFLKLRLRNLEKAEKFLTQQVQLKTKELTEEKNKVQKQNEEIARTNKRIISNIKYAKNIQESILPEREKLIEVLPESFILFKPKDIVSGDFYWYTKKNNRVVVAAVDCTGHGVSGAFMSIISNEFLNDIVIRKNILKPTMIMEKLHERILLSLTKNNEDIELMDGMDISICTIDPEKKFLEFGAARQSLILIRNDKIELIKGDNLPIGGYIYKDKRNYKSHIINIKNKDTVYIFTDGYCDQFGGKDNNKFMSARFYDLLLNIQKDSMPEQEKILYQTIQHWKGDNEQLDDILIIGMRF